MSREKDRRTQLPQLVVTGKGFRAFDPEVVSDRKDLTESLVRQDLEWDRSRREMPIAWTALLLGGAGLSMLLGASIVSYVLWFLAGAVGAFLVAAVVIGIVTPDREKAYRDDHRGGAPWLDIEADDRRAGLCSLAEDIASTRAWQDELIDPQRHLATIVWSAVSKVDTGENDDADVEAVAENLRQLLTVARDLDHRREYGTPATDDRVSAREPTARARALSSEVLENGRTVRDLS